LRRVKLEGKLTPFATHTPFHLVILLSMFIL